MSVDVQIRDLQRQIAKISGAISHIAGDKEQVLFSEYALQRLGLKLARPSLRGATKSSFENQVRKHLIPRFGMLPLGKVNNNIWLQWIKDEKGLSKFFNARKALIEIMKAAVEDGHIDKVPAIENPDEYEPVGRVLEDREALAIFWKAERPFRFIFWVMWCMGVRPREILQWEWDMITFVKPIEKTWLKVPARISKTGRNRAIALDPRISRILLRRFNRGNGSKYVFPARQDHARPQMSYQSAWVTACRKAGVTDAMVYDCRRTRITKWAAAGKQLSFIARQLDTSPIMIQRIYLKDDADAMEGLFRD